MQYDNIWTHQSAVDNDYTENIENQYTPVVHKVRDANKIITSTCTMPITICTSLEFSKCSCSFTCLIMLTYKLYICEQQQIPGFNLNVVSGKIDTTSNFNIFIFAYYTFRQYMAYVGNHCHQWIIIILILLEWNHNNFLSIVRKCPTYLLTTTLPQCYKILTFECHACFP